MAASSDFSQWMRQMGGAEGTTLEPASARSGFSQEGGDSDERLSTGEDKAEEQERSAEEKIKELEQEMKLLRWHKLANEAALKAALIKTKRIKAKETRAIERGVIKQKEKAAWMQQVIQEEQGKPLQVDETFIRTYKQREEKDDDRYEKDMSRHLTNLQRIKSQVAAREVTKTRNEVYKEKKKLLEKRARAIQEASLKRGLAARGAVDSLLDAPSLRDDLEAISSSFGGSESSQDNQQTKVITSLDKLVELEKRIAELEKDYEDSSRRVLFAKSRAEGSEADPAQTKYFVRVNKDVINRGSPRSSNQDEEGGGAFLTSLPPVKSIGVSSSTTSRGSSSKRSAASAARTSLVKRKLRGAQSQDAVVSKWLQGRQQKPTISKKSSTALVSANPLSRTIPSAKDRMKEFRQIRKQFDRKKQSLQRPLHATNDGFAKRAKPAVPSKSSSSTSKQRLLEDKPKRVAAPKSTLGKQAASSSKTKGSSVDRHMPQLAPSKVGGGFGIIGTRTS